MKKIDLQRNSYCKNKQAKRMCCRKYPNLILSRALLDSMRNDTALLQTEMSNIRKEVDVNAQAYNEEAKKVSVIGDAITQIMDFCVKVSLRI